MLNRSMEPDSSQNNIGSLLMNYKEIKKAKPVSEQDVRKVQETVSAIIEKVRSEGDNALRYYEKKFDSYEPESFQSAKSLHLRGLSEPAYRNLNKRSNRGCSWDRESSRSLPVDVMCRQEDTLA